MREKLIHLLVVAVFGGLFYVNSFGNFFVWNDWTLIIENFLIKDWQNLPEILTSAFWKPLLGEPFQIYRPLVSLSFMADLALWGLEPWGYHLTNVSLHVANAILAYFLMQVYVSPTIALMGAVLFAVHPIHTEAVAYISGRGELLMSFFLLSGTAIFLQSKKRRSWLLYLTSLPLFFSALLAKETAVVFPLLLLSADVMASPASWRSSPWRQSARQVGPFVILGIYYLLRKFFVGMTVSANSFAAPDFFDHLFLTLKAIPLYFGLLLFPLNLHFLHPIGPSSPLDFHLWLAIFLLAGAGWGLRCAKRLGNQAVAFALLWFLIGLLPLVYFTGWRLPLLEGWMYLPSLGFFLLVSVALDWLPLKNSSRICLWVAFLVAVLLGGVTFYRNRDWKDDLQISLHTVASSPNDPTALRLLGNARFRRGRTDEAEKILQEAILLAPEDPRLHESLGRLYSFLGKDQEALERYQRMKKLTPHEPYAYWRIGRFYLRRGNLAEAENYFAQATRLFPYSSELHNDLASAYFRQGKLDRARDELEAALKILPRSTTLQKNLEQVLNKNRR
jgi:tetratricopeptide (TPR) repeat protein